MKFIAKKKPVLSTKVEVEKEPEPKKEKKTRKTEKNTLPPDAYKDEITPIDLVIDDTRKLVFSVKRGGELGLPCVDLRQFQTTELYTGFTKKGVNIPVEYLCDLIEMLQKVYEECEEEGLLDIE